LSRLRHANSFQNELRCTVRTLLRACKRQAAEARAARPKQLAARPVETPKPDERDVVPWLRELGFNAREARSAAAYCSDLPDAPLEERVRAALRYFHPRRTGDALGGVKSDAPGVRQ